MPSIADDGAVVDRRQLAGERLGLELEDVRAAMGDVDGELAQSRRA